MISRYPTLWCLAGLLTALLLPALPSAQAESPIPQDKVPSDDRPYDVKPPDPHRSYKSGKMRCSPLFVESGTESDDALGIRAFAGKLEGGIPFSALSIELSSAIHQEKPLRYHTALSLSKARTFLATCQEVRRLIESPTDRIVTVPVSTNTYFTVTPSASGSEPQVQFTSAGNLKKNATGEATFVFADRAHFAAFVSKLEEYIRWAEKP